MSYPLQKSDNEWRASLTTEEYEVLREKDTETGGTGEYNKFYPKEGYFKCRGCNNPLYSAQSKFDSDCGWPAFDKCYKGGVAIERDPDGRRVEILCANCGGHLGHVFTGEQFTLTNERHCVNSISVRFDKGCCQMEEENVV